MLSIRIKNMLHAYIQVEYIYRLINYAFFQINKQNVLESGH